MALGFANTKDTNSPTPFAIRHFRLTKMGNYYFVFQRAGSICSRLISTFLFRPNATACPCIIYAVIRSHLSLFACSQWAMASFGWAMGLCGESDACFCQESVAPTPSGKVANHSRELVEIKIDATLACAGSGFRFQTTAALGECLSSGVRFVLQLDR